MRSVLLLLAVSIAAVAAFPKSSERILGGSTTTITQYPSVASLLFSKSGASYAQNYGGIILNNKAVLTAAHCVDGDIPSQWRIRVGSTYANSGGVVHNIYRIIIHSNYNRITAANNLAIIRSPTNIVFNNNVRAASIAGANYNLADNQIVWAVGWGATEYGGSGSEQLRHVQIWTVNQNVCRNRYAELRRNITDDMLCAGWLDVGGRDQCLGDSGGPLYHNGVVVGVISWGERCGLARYPGVSVRISRHTSWITTNAA